MKKFFCDVCGEAVDGPGYLAGIRVIAYAGGSGLSKEREAGTSEACSRCQDAAISQFETFLLTRGASAGIGTTGTDRDGL